MTAFLVFVVRGHKDVPAVARWFCNVFVTMTNWNIFPVLVYEHYEYLNVYDIQVETNTMLHVKCDISEWMERYTYMIYVIYASWILTANAHRHSRPCVIRHISSDLINVVYGRSTGGTLVPSLSILMLYCIHTLYAYIRLCVLSLNDEYWILNTVWIHTMKRLRITYAFHSLQYK